MVSASRFSADLEKNWRNIQDERQLRKINPKNLGPSSFCCHARTDATLVKALNLFAGAPTIAEMVQHLRAHEEDELYPFTCVLF